MSNLLESNEEGREADERTSLLPRKKSAENPLLLSGTHSISAPQGGISWYFAVFLIANAALGGGLLNFAKSFNEAGGVLVGSIIQIVLVIIIVGSLLIMAKCTEKTHSASYQDVMHKMCGKKWQTVNSICIILYTYGVCVTYLIIIGDQLDQVVVCIFGKSAFIEHWFLDRKYTIVVTSLILVLPMCYPKEMDFLTYPSTFGVIAIIYIAILIPIKYTMIDVKNVVTKTKPDHWSDVFSVIPVVCFSYQCHVNAVPLYVCLKKRNLPEFTKSIIVAVITIFCIYTLSATFGYLTFGINVNDDLLKSYDSTDVTVLIAIIMFLLKTYTSYPLNLYCARTALEDIWIGIYSLDQVSARKHEALRRRLIVTVWFFTTLLIAVFIPNISIVIAYLGALASSFMFTFPGLCLLSFTLDRDNRIDIGNRTTNASVNDSSDKTLKSYNRTTRLLLVISVFYVALGTFIAGLVVTQALIRDITHKQ